MNRGKRIPYRILFVRFFRILRGSGTDDGDQQIQTAQAGTNDIPGLGAGKLLLLLCTGGAVIDAASLDQSNDTGMVHSSSVMMDQAIIPPVEYLMGGL